MYAQVNVASNTSHVVSIALQKKANATLLVSKPQIVLIPMTLSSEQSNNKSCASCAHPQLHAHGKADKCIHPLVALMGSDFQSQL